MNKQHKSGVTKKDKEVTPRGLPKEPNVYVLMRPIKRYFIASKIELEII